MNYIDMTKIVDKVKRLIPKSNGTLYILTDNNEDNFSYIRGLIKVNEKEGFVKNIVSIDVNGTDDFYALPEDRIYIMTSVFDSDYTRRVIGRYPNICYSEIIEDCRKIYPTASAILDTIMYYCDNDLAGVNIVVANKSKVIGRPLINLLLDKGATVHCVHTKTTPATKEMLFSLAEIIVTAAGKPNTFKTVGPASQLIVDAGINIVDGKVTGDWSYKDIEYKSDLTITPNPGRIGKLTTYELFKELFKV